MANLSNINNKFIVEDSGDVGIGVTAATSKLHLRDPGVNSDVGIKIGNDSRDWNLKVMGSVSDSLQFFTHDNSNVMTILPSGNVGIGTNSPDAKLHIYGSSSLSEMYLGEDAAADKAGILKYTQGDGSGTGVITLSHWGNTSTTQSLAIKYGGNVGIGTISPQANLHIDANSGILTQEILKVKGGGSGGAYGFLVEANNGDDLFKVDTSTYNCYFPSSFTKVGIGTDSPDAKLEVEGNINSGFYSVFAKNTNAGSSAFVSKKWLNDDAAFGEIWRNSSTRSSGGQQALSFNMYNSNDINFWSGASHTMALVGNNVGIGTDSPSYGKLQIDQTSGNNLTLRKGTGTAAVAFGGVTNNEATFLIEGHPAASGFKLYNGAGTLASPTWTAGMDFYDGGRLHPYGGVFLGSSNTSNLLNDYEEGTWTPVLQGGSVTGAATYSTQLGKYTKIGRLVTFWFSITWTTHTGSGTAQVAGLPFASGNGSQTPACGVFTYKEPFTANNVPNGGIISSAGTIWYHWQVPVGGGISSGIPLISDVNGKELQVNGQYYTA